MMNLQVTLKLAVIPQQAVQVAERGISVLMVRIVPAQAVVVAAEIKRQLASQQFLTYGYEKCMVVILYG